MYEVMGRLVILYAIWAGVLLTFLGDHISGHGAFVVGRAAGPQEGASGLGDFESPPSPFEDNRLPIESNMGGYPPQPAKQPASAARASPWAPPQKPRMAKQWGKPWGSGAGRQENETTEKQPGGFRQISLNMPGGKSEGTCWIEMEARVNVVSVREGKMLVSWTEICERKGGRGRRYKRGPRNNKVDGEGGRMGCRATPPCFAFDEDDMAILIGAQVDKLIGETGDVRYDPGCVAVYYRYSEMNGNTVPDMAAGMMGNGWMWPGVKVM